MINTLTHVVSPLSHISQKIINAGCPTALGTSIGCTFVVLFSLSVISGGKNIYLDHRLPECKHKTCKKIIGIAVMAFGTLAALASSTLLSFFIGTVVGAYQGGPMGAKIGMIAGGILGIACVVGTVTFLGQAIHDITLKNSEANV